MERMGNISEETRENTRGNLPTKEKGHRSHRAKMDYTNGKMGNRKGERRNRTSIQNEKRPTKEVDKGERDLLKQQKNRNQREIMMAWKDAVEFLKRNKDKIKYSRTPNIDLDNGNEKRRYRAYKNSKRNMKEIKEYTDWNNGETFENNPINISRDNYRLVQIRKYISTARNFKLDR